VCPWDLGQLDVLRGGPGGSKHSDREFRTRNQGRIEITFLIQVYVTVRLLVFPAAAATLPLLSTVAVSWVQRLQLQVIIHIRLLIA
jgi:hypothetical protein